MYKYNKNDNMNKELIWIRGLSGFYIRILTLCNFNFSCSNRPFCHKLHPFYEPIEIKYLPAFISSKIYILRSSLFLIALK